MRTSFWTYFTSGYGTIWLILLACSFLIQRHIDAGLFGLLGFPIIALVYAGIRRSQDEEKLRADRNSAVISPKMVEFLDAHPEFIRSPDKIRDAAFHKWLNDAELD